MADYGGNPAYAPYPYPQAPQGGQPGASSHPLYSRKWKLSPGVIAPVVYEANLPQPTAVNKTSPSARGLETKLHGCSLKRLCGVS